MAVAIRYDPGKRELPYVTARGRGRIAQRIVELARRHGIPVHSHPPLARLLQRLDVGSPIPIEAYVAVAEILALLYRLDAEGDGEGRG